jgi:AcrR family transcriptional regulator
MVRKPEPPVETRAPAADAPMARKFGKTVDARRVIYACGLQGASVDEIAREAGIADARAEETSV